jgi:hypothetical protein
VSERILRPGKALYLGFTVALLALLLTPVSGWAQQLAGSSSTYSVVERIQRAAPEQKAPVPTIVVPPPSAARSPQTAVERALQRRLSPDHFSALMTGVRSATARPGAQRAQQADPGRSDAIAPPQSPPILQSRSKITAGYANGSAEEAREASQNYGGIPGGIVLEGTADFGSLSSLGYDSRFNALVLNESTVYFVPVAPSDLAVLSRALADDNRIGVSLGEEHLVFGRAPANSRLIMDLKIADNFLGEIVFAQEDWTRGYRFANNYKPKPHIGDSLYVAIFFKFGGFRFALVDNELSGSHADLNVRLFPLADTPGADGSLQPDTEAIGRGTISAQYEANAKHLTANIDYYRKERIVNQMFAYGEVAALLRGLRDQGFDLEGLARSVGSGGS